MIHFFFGNIPLDVISPTGIDSAEAFGTTTVSGGDAILTPTGIASAEAFGTATITHAAIEIIPTGIASGEAFGFSPIVLVSSGITVEVPIKRTTGVLTITDNPVKRSDESLQIDLTASDVAYALESGVVFATPILVVRKKTIKKIGRKLDSLDSLTTRSRLIKKQVQAVERMHGTVQNEIFRFVADKAP